MVLCASCLSRRGANDGDAGRLADDSLVFVLTSNFIPQKQTKTNGNASMDRAHQRVLYKFSVALLK